MIIELVHGYETFDGYGSIRVDPIICDPVGKPQGHVIFMARDSLSGIRQISANSLFASSANVNHGKWHIGRYTVPEYTYIILAFSRKRNFDPFATLANVVLLMRENAAHHRLSIPFTGHSEANQSVGHIEGKFDILSRETLDMLGWHTSSLCNDNLHEIMFEDRIIASEASNLAVPKTETLVTRSGREVKITKKPMPRKLIFRHNK